MKKIPLWIIALLNIITLGLYLFVWLARRRNELVTKYDQKVPHWWWLIAPVIILLIAVIAIVGAATIAPETSTTETAIGLAILGVVIPGALAVFAIDLWWMINFGRASEKVTGGRISSVWITLLYFLGQPFMNLFGQYYFNRVPEQSSDKSATVQSTSISFIVLAIASILASFVLYAALSFATGDFGALQEELEKIEQLEERTKALQKEYDDCLEQLDTDFPGDITLEQETAYSKAFDHCDDIRIEQNQAADEYNELISTW